MTTEQHEKIRLNYIYSNFINAIGLWIRYNDYKKFKKLTGISDTDFDKMVNLTYEWDIKTCAKITVATGLELYVVANFRKPETE